MQQSIFDVCIVCALYEEARAVLHVLAKVFGIPIRKAFSAQGFQYHATELQNLMGEKISLLVTWLPRYGPMETSIYLSDLLREMQPRFVGMSGICAGDREKVSLGDIIVAERAFVADGGKYALNEKGERLHQHDAYTAHISRSILQNVHSFDRWQEFARALPRPPSKRQQRDWLMCRLLTEASPRIDAIPNAELKQYVPAWRKIVQEGQKEPGAWLTLQRALMSKEKVNELCYGAEEFPYTDPEQPACYIAPMASTSSVRADKPFDDIHIPVRNTLALDMEGATFYRAIEEFADIDGLVVKGVSDYADSDKDDSYHEYAAYLSALYLLGFVQEYITTQLIPRKKREEKPDDAQRNTSMNSIGSIAGENISIQQGHEIHNRYYTDHMPKPSSDRKAKEQ